MKATSKLHKTEQQQLRQTQRKRRFETVIHGIFLVLGLVTVGCVLMITVYLIIAGIPAIREIGLVDFLFGKVWASTNQDAKFGILPFILTSVYGTAGAILIGVPVGFFTAVYLAKEAPPKLRGIVEEAVNLLAGIPSVVYGLVGMLILVPGIRNIFHVPDGSSLLAAIIVLAIMILPSIIKVLSPVWKRYRRNMRTRLWRLERRRQKPGSRFRFRRPEAVSRQPSCWVSAARSAKRWQ